MAYKYDVFLSYNLKFPHGNWVNELFLPFFKPHLEDALNIKDVKIFKDTEEILNGQLWDKKIEDALIHSRIMVSICSPAYFNSEWCKREFAIMDYRQRRCGYMSKENQNGIILPIKVSDGEHFSEHVNTFQIESFNDFFRLEIKGTKLYVDLQEKILRWMKSVVHAYNNAPAWDEDWKKPEWISEALLSVNSLVSSPSKIPPTL